MLRFVKCIMSMFNHPQQLISSGVFGPEIELFGYFSVSL